MAELEVPPVVRLLLEVAALRLKMKLLEREVAALKAPGAPVEAAREV